MVESQTDYAVATGEFIEEWMESNHMNAAELARRTGVSPKHISTVLAGAPVTSDFAGRLARVTNVPAERWLALEGQYRADLERLGLARRLEANEDLMATFKESVSALRKMGIVQGDRRKPGHLMIQLMTFFQVGSPEALVPRNLLPQACFLKSATLDSSTASLATWLRLAQIRAQEAPTFTEFSPEALQEALPDIRAMSRRVAAEPMAFVGRLALTGVRAVILEEIKGCRAYGATFWDDHGPVIVLSARGKQDGALWFTLFHELGHVLLHPNQLFVEDSSDVGPDDGRREEEANAFAADCLIPAPRRAEAAALKSKVDVRQFAETLDVSPGVVMQHVHHYGHWPYANGRDLYVKVEIVDE